MGTLIGGLVVGVVAMVIFIFTHWLLKNRWSKYKWSDSVVLTILLLSTVWIISLALRGLPLSD